MPKVRQRFWENPLVKWPFLAAGWSGTFWSNVVQFFQFQKFFFLEISILDEKCDLLMDIMLMSLKKWQSKRGAKKRHLQLFEPLHFFKFLSYINMMHFKRSLFLCRIEISIKNLLFEMKKLEKKPIEKYHFILLLKMVIFISDFTKNFKGLGPV